LPTSYATSCGIKTTIFCPADTPEVNVSEIELQGATVYRVNGLIDDCGKIVGEGKAKVGWFDTSTLKEPYRIEGKKTITQRYPVLRCLDGRCSGCPLQSLRDSRDTRLIFRHRLQ
jgi:Pyridoxal-phosphate dependent enzyme